jgi:hypothetical protein
VHYSLDCVDVEEIIVQMNIEGRGINVESLALTRQDGEHSTHHQQGVPSTIHCIIDTGTDTDISDVLTMVQVQTAANSYTKKVPV